MLAEERFEFLEHTPASLLIAKPQEAHASVVFPESLA
jgi:hypothetical protein